MIFKLNRAKIQKRQYVIFCMFFVMFCILYWRIVSFQYVKSGKLSVMENNQYSYIENLTDTNYLLFDCNGKQLIDYTKKYYVVISPEIYIRDNLDTNSDDLLTLMYILRNYNSNYDLSKIGTLNTSQKLYYEVDENTYNKLKLIKGVKGFYVYTYLKSNKGEPWKIENMLTSIRRTDNNKLKSPNSLEMQIYNKTKANQIPKIVFERDINGNIIQTKTELPKNNLNVRLTLDKNIEEKIKGILNNSANRNYKQIGVVLMEANTGKIKALVQKDDTKPNVNLGVSTNHGFYPGSIFKVIVEEAALENNSISLNDRFTDRGFYEKDNGTHQTYTPEQAFIVSCNDVFAQIGSKVGFNNFYNNAIAQGLEQKVLGLDSEERGAFEVKDAKNSNGTLGLASIGQKIRITPLEAISIANTVANNGIYVKPHIIDAYVDDNNNVKEYVNTQQQQLLKKSTANTMKEQMIKVVEQGTAKAALTDNVEIGGKTGTTQRMEISRSTGKVVEHSDGWFAGFFRVSGKYYSMIVFVQDINKDTEEGGTTSAPIFKDIVTSISKYLVK